MGYELVFSRERQDVEGASDESVEWFCCGWSLQGLYSALSGLASERLGEFELRVRVSDVAFVGRLVRQLRTQSLLRVMEALCELDDDYAYELMESLPDFVVSAIRLSFVLEGCDERELAVCRELCELFLDGSFGCVYGLGALCERLESTGVDEVFVSVSF